MPKKVFEYDLHTAIIVGIILLVTLVVANVVRLSIARVIRRATRDTHYDPTGLLFTKRIIIVLVYLIGIGFALAQIPEFKMIGHSLIAGAGVITLITGLASQQVLSNIMSGILIVIFKPFRLNDKISLDGMTGTVEDINLRQIVLRDVENNRIVIPNSLVNTNSLINYSHTDTRCCKAIEIGIGYSSDIDRAMAIMVEEVLQHPLHIDARTPEQVRNGAPEVVARVVSLGDSSVNISVWTWASDSPNSFTMNCDLLKSIKQRFDAEDIEIPFPQRALTQVSAP